MTYFSKTFNNLTEIEVNWFIEQQEFSSTNFNFFPSSVPSGEYYDLREKGEPSDSETLETWFECFDNYVLKFYNNIDINKQKFHEWCLIRNFYIKKILQYKKQYDKLGFNFDLFPNFGIYERNKFIFNSQTGIYEQKDERVVQCSSESDGCEANPIVLAVFLQKFLQIWRPKQIIKFAYHPDLGDDISAGIVEINSEFIKMSSIEDFCEDDFQ